MSKKDLKERIADYEETAMKNYAYTVQQYLLNNIKNKPGILLISDITH